MASDPEDLLRQGYAARRDHRAADAERDFAAALAVFRRDGNPRGEALALAGVARMDRDAGRREAARESYGLAVEIWRREDDAVALAHAVRHLADVDRETGRNVSAERGYDEALATCRARVAEDPLELANTLRGLALLMQTLNARERASALWREARALYATSGVDAGVAESDRRIAALQSSE